MVTKLLKQPPNEILPFVNHRCYSKALSTAKLATYPEVAAQTTLLLEHAGLDKTQVFDLLKDIDAVWQNLFPIEQQKIIHTLIRAVYVSTEGIDVRINQNGLQSLLLEAQDEETV